MSASNLRPSDNLIASVRQRLLNLAKARNEDFQRLLTQYALERMLYRIGQSRYASQFTLKGALLFQLWLTEPHRRTKDLDLLSTGEPATEQAVAVFQELCALDVEPDGLYFDPAAVNARHIREDNIYGGLRVNLVATLGKARVPLQIDIGYGDAVIPPPTEIAFPVLLDFPVPHLRAYSRETVVAEKVSAIVELDLDNSRMKDFFDLWMLAQRFSFAGEHLSEAVAATFARRAMSIPVSVPVGLSEAFAANPAKQI